MKSPFPSFLVQSTEIEQRAANLLSRLTLEEKILLLSGQSGRGATRPISRLGIPELKMSDGPMGVHWWCSHATAYPALFCAAASFDRQLWWRLGQSLGRDARARGVHILLAPGVNLYRSALCGRNFEYAGEDPFLAAQVGKGFIEGVQSMGVAATVKHFAVNFQEYDRHNISSDVDERTLFEVYLPAFETAVVEAGVGAVMTAYNLIGGVHCSEHAELLRGVLKERWGFFGVVMSDWVSTYSTEATANAGLDLEMPTAEWYTLERLLPLLRDGRVAESTIDDKVRRLLRLAICFGWLDREQLDASLGEDDPESKQVALEVARRGIVLLKNRDNLLPLEPAALRSVAVVGPSAHPAVFSGGGSACTTPGSTTSILEGLRSLMPEGVVIHHAAGPEPNPERHVFGSSIFSSTMGAGLKGEYFNNGDFAGEPAVTRLDAKLDFVWGPSSPVPEITVEHFSARWSGAVVPERSGRHVFYARSHDSVYRVTLDDQVLVDTLSGERNGLFAIPVVLEAGRQYQIAVAWRKTRYWGGMQVGWECVEGHGQAVRDCVALAKESDVAVVCVGFDHVSEGEGFDRPFGMHRDLEELVREVVAVQPRTVVVLTAGGNVDMTAWLDQVPALLFASYPGQEGGRAVAEILLGLVNPSGKLPATFEKRLEDRSSFNCYHDTDGDRRVALTDGVVTGYRYAEVRGIEPNFPFGFGLSYSTFRYHDLELSRLHIHPGESLEVSFLIENTSERAGSEIAQVYVRHPDKHGIGEGATLKQFGKVELAAGASSRLTLTLSARAFAFYDVGLHDFSVVPGTYEIMVGASAADIRLRAALTIE